MPSLAMTLHNDSRCPHVELKINGKWYRFLVDTGASATVLSPELAKELHFVANVSVGGFTGKDRANLMSGKINILGRTLYQCLVANIDQIGMEIHGILGQDLFQQFRQLEFDYVVNIVRFKE